MMRIFMKKLSTDYAACRVEAMRRRDDPDCHYQIQIALFDFVRYCPQP